MLPLKWYWTDMLCRRLFILPGFTIYVSTYMWYATPTEIWYESTRVPALHSLHPDPLSLHGIDFIKIKSSSMPESNSAFTRLDIHSPAWSPLPAADTGRQGYWFLLSAYDTEVEKGVSLLRLSITPSVPLDENYRIEGQISSFYDSVEELGPADRLYKLDIMATLRTIRTSLILDKVKPSLTSVGTVEQSSYVLHLKKRLKK